MKIKWLEKNELFPAVNDYLNNVPVVLDIGCGIRPQKYLRPIVHICFEPFIQYIEVLQEKIRYEHDRTYIIFNGTWADAVKFIPPKSVDTVVISDVIEHLEKNEALKLLRDTEPLARNQIVIFTPLGFLPQKHDDGKDAWGLNGGVWQEHKSGWDPDDFDETWEIIASRNFHFTDNNGKSFDMPKGAMFAIKNIGTINNTNEFNFNNIICKIWRRLSQIALLRYYKALSLLVK